METTNLELVYKEYKSRTNDIEGRVQNVEQFYRKEINKKDNAILFMKRYINLLGFEKHFNTYLKQEIKNIEKNTNEEELINDDYYNALEELNLF